MSGLSALDRLEAAKAEVLRLEREVAAGPCRENGHSWAFLGGRNAGCDDACQCSVPVYQCTKCGDCDYGDNPEALAIKARCQEEGEPA